MVEWLCMKMCRLIGFFVCIPVQMYVLNIAIPWLKQQEKLLKKGEAMGWISGGRPFCTERIICMEKTWMYNNMYIYIYTYIIYIILDNIIHYYT